MNEGGIDRPAGLRLATLLLCVFNVAGILFYEPMEGMSADASLALFAVYAVVAAVSFVVIWFFWRGRNWARWLVFATSVIALLNLLLIPSSVNSVQLLIVAEAVLAVWLLYWLNTPRSTRYFKQPHRA